VRSGLESKRWFRTNYRRLVQLHGPTQDIPSPDGRVTLSESVKDAFGLPVARLSGTIHPSTIPTAQFLATRAEEWLKAAGAAETWRRAPDRAYLSGGQHQAGTCRMADSPTRGVVDTNQRVFGHDNLFVCDASVHVTNGGFNPALTIFALAFRLGTYLTGNRK
jgi:choline dehydrogenase-like flavoprotein